ncbi:MAG: hypothetical protein IJM08_01940 [Firmicutes bacterium]|nr:hypothetical protein [Bacillota bacterium]
MFCTNCGKKLPEDAEGRVIASFCPNCGTKVPVFTEAVAETISEPVKEQAETIDNSVETIKEAAEATAESINEAAEESAETVQEAAKETIKEITEAGPEAEPEDEEPAWIVPEGLEGPGQNSSKEKTAAAGSMAQEKAAPAQPAQEAKADPVQPAQGTKAEPAQAVQQAEEEKPSAANDVEEKIPAVAAAQPESAKPAEPAAPKKKSKAPIIALLLIAALAIGGFFVYQNLPSTKAAKLVKQAEERMMTDDYYGAVGLLNDAAELQPENTDIPEKIIDAWMANARYMAESDDDSMAIDLYRVAASKARELQDSGKTKAYLDQIGTEISSIINYYIENESYYAALQLLDAKAEMLPEQIAGITREKISIYEPWIREVLDQPETAVLKGFKEEILEPIEDQPEFAALEPLFKEVDDRLESAERIERLGLLGKDLIIYTKNDSQSLACSSLYIKLISSIAEYNNLYKWTRDSADQLPIIASIPGSDQSIGLYRAQGALFCYIGKYEGRKRSGEGVWFTYLGNALTDNRRYYARGTWANDMPNGEFTAWDWTKHSGDENETEITYAGNVKDGLFEGKIKVTYKDLDTFVPNYVNGTPQILDTTEYDGEARYITAYGENTTYYLSNVLGDKFKDGILGFYSNSAE